MTTSTGYDGCTASAWHPGGTATVAIIVGLFVAAIACHDDPHRLAHLGAIASVAGAAGWSRGRPSREAFRLAVGTVAVVVVVVVGGAWRGDRAWSGLAPDRLGPYAGWVEVATDPAPLARATRVIVEIDGERFEVFVRRRGMQARVGEWNAGDLVFVSGDRTALAPPRRRRVASQHVVGAFDVEWVSDVHAGAALAVASNRVRHLVERGAAALPEPHAALFRGLVVGDDRDQPLAMVAAFRGSGLSHLTAVSGQNVAFVLAAAGPVLRSLRPGPRLAATIALIAWFVSLTRFEPSILRAGVMAGLTAVATATGRDRSPGRVLALAVGGLVMLDPLLVWSVGFWMSVGATLGVSELGPRIAARLAGWGRAATPIGITLGAQAGVALPSLVVFGRLPLVSVVANPLAVPVAGMVMLYGLPASIVAGAVPALAGVVMAPAGIGVRWVDAVARLGAWAEPGPPLTWLGWCLVAIAVAAGGRRRPRPAVGEPDARA